MNLTLRQFQNAFVDALYGRPAPQLSEWVCQAAFGVYRNTVFSGCAEAVQANFPSVRTLVGKAWMDETAAIYAQLSPPSDARLICYGATFPDFLEQIQPQHNLAYLADVARLDLCWIEAFSAFFEPCLDLADLAGVTASDLDRSYLTPRACARWFWCEQHPVYALWRCAREQLDWDLDQAWAGEGVLFVASDAGVCHQPLEKGGWAFLEACAAGQSLADASVAAQLAQADLDFTDLLGRLIRAQVFRPLAFMRADNHG